MNWTHKQRGQALLLVTLALPVVFGFAALVADVGWAYYRREVAQAAAEAATSAAARAVSLAYPSSVPVCADATKVYCGAAKACPSRAPVTMTTSFENACALAAANGFVTAGRQTVTIQAGTNSAPPTAPGITANYWVVARVSERALGFFGSLAGNPLSPTARSTVALIPQGTSGAGCLYVLNPHAQDALLADNNAQVTANCGVYVNSDGKAVTPTKEAMYVTGSAKVSVGSSSINVVGSLKEDNNGSHAGTVSQNTGKVVDDPLKTVPAPTPGSCLPASAGNMSPWQSAAYTPGPGTYCNGFTLSNGNKAIMAPGVYIINGGTFSIQSGPLTASGGVTIFLTNGATMNLANGTTVTLSAQSSGDYQGILFYSDRAYTPGASSIAGGANLSLSGSLYFPTSTLNINNGTTSTGTKMAIVADKVHFAGGATVMMPATSDSDTGIKIGGVILSTIE